MGNHLMISHRLTMRVILPDGTLQEYPKPVTVAELMLDHPQQVVVEFQNGRKPTPLPADTKLESSKVYMMLPMRRGKPIMSSEEARRLLLRANAVLNSSAYTGFLPLFARICPAAVSTKSKKKESLQEIKPHDEVVVKPAGGLFMEMEGRGDYYLSRQMSWKPSLDTIKEKGVKAKIRHWLL